MSSVGMVLAGCRGGMRAPGSATELTRFPLPDGAAATYGLGDPLSLFLQREPVDRLAAKSLARLQHRAREVVVMHRVGKVLRFQRNAIARAGEDLQPRLVCSDFEHAT